MERDGFTGRAGESFVELFLVWAASVGLTLTVSSFFLININVEKAILWILLWSVGIFAATRFRRGKYFILLIALFLWLFGLWKNWERIEEKQDILYVMFLAVLIIAVSVFLYRSNIVMISLSLLLVFAMLHYDQYPDYKMLFLWFAAVLALKVMGKSGGARRAFWVFFVSLLLMAFVHERISGTVALTLRENDDKVRYFQQKLNLKWENFLRGLDKRTYINGKLDNTNPGNNDEVDIVVSVNERPKTNIYLRGFVGGNYTSDDWKILSDSAFLQEAGKWNLGGVEDVQAQLLSAWHDRLNPDFFMKRQLHIQNVDYDGEYALVPYCCKINRQHNFVADGLVKNSGAGEFVYECCFLENIMMDEWWHESSPLQEKYTEYVNQMYLGDWQGLINLRKVCEYYEGHGFVEAENFIKNYLSANCSYSKELDPLPYGVDYAEFFMFTQKKGYCSHFATAGALMFRALGYPARYVAGYVARPDEFVKDGPGYTAQITGNSAHAWVEVYLDGIWYPVELTPGYMATAIRYEQKFAEEETEAKADEEEEDEDEEDEEDTDEQEEKNPEDEEENLLEFLNGNLNSFFSNVVRILAVMAGGVLALLLRRLLVVLYYQTIYRKSRNKKAVLVMARRAFGMAKAAGYDCRGMTDVQAAQRIGRQEFAQLVEIAQKAKFSAHGVTEEERKRCFSANQQIEKGFYGSLSRWDKLCWKYLWCFR